MEFISRLACVLLDELAELGSPMAAAARPVGGRWATRRTPARISVRMSERRIDQVRIQLSAAGPVVISWDSRQALLTEMRLPSNAGDAQRAFQDVGTSDPVNLTPEQKGDVITVLEPVAAEVAGGDDDLPDDLFELRNALRIDVATTG